MKLAGKDKPHISSVAINANDLINRCVSGVHTRNSRSNPDSGETKDEGGFQQDKVWYVVFVMFA